jgi:hypothetical protein
MSCSKTQHVLVEYFADDLALIAKKELENHLVECPFCSSELELLLNTQNKLGRWEEESVPHWNRGLALFRQEHRIAEPGRGFWYRWQWIPTVASFAMLCLLLFNVSLSSDDGGIKISFGTDQPRLNIESYLAGFEQQQHEAMENLAIRVEDRQDANNLRLMQAVLDQAQEATAQSLDQMAGYFEQQRQLDIQDFQVGYQELADSDYETIRSLQQLATFISYQETVD